ncbi:MAG TPA: hypothetical protein VFG24_03040 [Nitrosopumilaceae archaeon]|nr:hypothetical protein [Nitrosopumilaceae archaeon]
MNPKVEISSLFVSKLKNNVAFEKYNIDASIDEVENNELGIKIKYKFILISTPTNSKISVEGLASILGNETEVTKYLAPDEKNIPNIVNTIYQELFPLFYIVTKGVEIPCPASKISQISEAAPAPIKDSTQIPEVPQTAPKELEEIPKVEAVEQISEPQPEQSDTLEDLEKLIEEQNVSPN